MLAYHGGRMGRNSRLQLTPKPFSPQEKMVFVHHLLAGSPVGCLLLLGAGMGGTRKDLDHSSSVWGQWSSEVSVHVGGGIHDPNRCDLLPIRNHQGP